MNCSHDCAQPPLFPRAIENRPGLERIDYRIGSYADLRGHLLAAINTPLALTAWTHREPDDPAIALLESAAIVGDVLTFYQELYANEAFLRTAGWRESVADLVRLTGYRLAPGLGGEAVFAVLAKGERPVVVPRGLGIKAQLATDPKPAEFETTAETTAIPELSHFHLVHPAATPLMTTGQSVFAVPAADMAALGIELRKGDRLMLVANPSLTISPRQIVVVDEVRSRFEHTEIAIEGAWRGGTVAGPVSAYKLKRSFRHFGHNAPTVEHVIQNGASVSQVVSFSLPVARPSNVLVMLIAGQYHWRPDLNWLGLDRQVDDLAIDGTVLVTLQLSTDTAGLGAEHLVARRLRGSRKATAKWGPMEGPTTAIELDQPIAANPPLTPPPSGGGLVIWFGEYLYSDVRTVEIHEVEGMMFSLTAARTPAAAFDPARLACYGTQDAYTALHGRRLAFVRDGTVETAVATIDGPAAALSGERLRPVTLNPPLATFGAADFPWDDPPVEVYGNLVEAAQGKTEDEVPLGDGDARQAFQSFPLPKAPLTYLLDPERDPRYRPELEVRVGGVLWQAVDTLFGHVSDARVYVVREDAEGKSCVQFGDGRSGARLPTGKGNVTAVYRTGSGATGPAKPDAKPQAGRRIDGLDALAMPGPAAGGAPPEAEENARAAAPARMQSLGRVVSLADYEAEALMLPGVLKANATWSAIDAAPVIRIVVLTESNAPADAQAAAQALRSVAAARGPARYPLVVVIGQRLPVTLTLQAGFDPLLREEDVRHGILEALGAGGEEGNGVDSGRGLFSWQRRRFGQGVHASQIVAAAQNAEGVHWVRLIGWPLQQALPCPDDRLFALAAADLTLSLTREEEAA
jgi:hypothetical protein